MNQIDVWISSNYTKEKEISKFWKLALRNYAPSGDCSLEYNAYGKPRLKNHDKLYFNVSHTDEVAILGVSVNIELGVDLESTTRKISNIESIIDKYFHEYEKLNLKQSIKPERDFIYLWVIKEAFSKMKGLGIDYGLVNFIVDTNKENIFDIKEQKYYRYNLIELNNNFVCCVVPRFDIVRFFNF